MFSKRLRLLGLFVLAASGAHLREGDVGIRPDGIPLAGGVEDFYTGSRKLQAKPQDIVINSIHDKVDPMKETFN